MNIESITSAEKQNNLKAKISFLVKLTITALLLIYLFNYVHLSDIFETLHNSNASFLLLGLVLLIPNIYLQYVKWRMTCRQLFGETNKRKILVSLFCGFPPAIFTPGRTGEYVGRGIVFKERTFMEIILATFVDKLFSGLVIFILGLAATFVFINEYYQSSNIVSIPLLILLILFLVFTITIILSRKEWLIHLISPLFEYSIFNKVKEKVLILKRLDNNYSLRMFSVSTLFFLCYVLQFVILIVAFSHRFDISNYFLAAILIMFTKSIFSPITIGDLGVREGASIFFLTQMGELSSTALNASLTLFFINIIIPSIIGLFFLLAKNDH